ncbi:MAG: hypothetical protein K2H01_03200 [Ruminococcus sp.]|nr:hypothetical protein [Ruminococcus sp.]
MTKTELLAYKNIKAMLRDIEKRIANLKADAQSPKGIRYSDMPKGRDEPMSSQQRYIEQLEELSQLYEAEKNELMKTQIAIERAIYSMPLELRLLMRYRYIDGLRWNKVNQQIGEIYGKETISERTSKRLHDKALRYLQNI